MKLRNILIAAVGALLAVSTLSSCGKKTATSAMLSNEREVTKTKSLQLAEQKPMLRGYGEGTHNSQSFARTYAEGQARAELARKLGAQIVTASEQTTDGAQISHSDLTDQSMGEDEGVLSNAKAEQIASGAIKNTAVINTDVFQRKDGKYHVYVCIEYMASIGDLAKDIANGYKKQIGQQVSDEDRAKMEVRAEEFRKRIEERLTKLNGSTF